VGEFLPFYIKILPFVGSMFSVALVFITNCKAFEVSVSNFYNDSNYRVAYHFLSHK
jgi:hypothetical protein